VSPAPRTRRVARRIGWALVLSAACSLALAVTYVLGGQPQVEGTLLLGSLGGLAVALVLWGKSLMPVGAFVEEREPAASPEADQDAFVEQFERGEALIARRPFLARLLLGALGALGLALVFPIRSLGPRPGRALVQTSWSGGARLVRPDGTLVRDDALSPGGILTVFPEGHTDAADAQTVLLRVAPDAIVPVPGRDAWTPEGFLAYSKICTHAGCPVGLYEATTGRLFCPCHQSVFDALRGARPVGGPATRPLPQLPLTVDAEGYLAATGDFSSPVGPGFWSLP
jgi:ubiquinol-cytochrome c reductase iron-sulfur subunit